MPIRSSLSAERAAILDRVSLFLLVTVLLQPAPARELAQLSLYSSFWVNLHHTLYAASRPAGRSMPSAPPLDMTAAMTAAEREAWTRATRGAN